MNKDPTILEINEHLSVYSPLRCLVDLGDQAYWGSSETALSCAAPATPLGINRRTRVTTQPALCPCIMLA